MTRKFFAAVCYLLSAVVICAALLIAAVSYIARDLPHYTRLLFEQTARATDCRITFDDIDWSIAPGAGVRITNVKVSDAVSGMQIASCARLSVQTSLFALLKRRFSVSRITVAYPEITLMKTPEGWRLPPFPTSLPQSSGRTGLLDFSVSIKKIIIENAFLRILDEAADRSVDIADVSCTLLRNRKRDCYDFSGDVKSPGAGAASAFFSGSFGFAGRIKSPGTITGSAAVRLQEIPLATLRALVRPAGVLPDISGRVSGTATCELNADRHLDIRGAFATGPLQCLDNNTRATPLDPLSIRFNAALDSPTQGTADCEVTAGGDATITAAASLRRVDGDNGTALELRASSPHCTVSWLKTCLRTLPQARLRFPDVLDRFQSGTITLDSLRARVFMADNGTVTACLDEMRATIDNMFIKLHDSLPSLHCRAENLAFSNHTLTTAVHGRMFEDDNHTVTLRYGAGDSLLYADITSSVSSEALNNLRAALLPFARSDLFTALGGTARLHTAIQHDVSSGRTDCAITADLTDSVYCVAGFFTKPVQTHNQIRVTVRDIGDNATAPVFSFDADLAHRCAITGTVAGARDPVLLAAWSASAFDIAPFIVPSLPPAIEISAIVGGSGLVLLPCPAPSGVPALGMISLDRVTLDDLRAGARLSQLSCMALLSPRHVSLLNASASFGVTNGCFSGSLQTLLPPAGRLRVMAQVFDIDDFVGTVERIMTLTASGGGPFEKHEDSAPGLFSRTNLDMAFTADRVNFMDWDFFNGRCRYTYRSGVMRWDNITVTGGNGTIQGSVAFDFSRSDTRSLTIAPTQSSSDFIWAIPGMRTKQTITGTLDLRGTFTSSFALKKDLGINMQGSFNATVHKGVIRKFTILSKILSLMNIIKLAKINAAEIMEKGMPFETMTGSFTLDRGIMKTGDLMVRGPAMNLSAVGDIDLRHDSVDLTVGAQIFPTISRIIGTIPVAGALVTGKDKSLTIGYFHVKGPYDDAAVKPMPVKTISGPVLRVFRTILDIPRDIFPHESDNQTRR